VCVLFFFQKLAKLIQVKVDFVGEKLERTEACCRQLQEKIKVTEQSMLGDSR
jgi:hypothetical protein